MPKFAPEGYPFIVISGLITAGVCIWPGPYFSAVPAVVFLFMLWFFRDPERVAPQGPDVFVSPADGRVIVARPGREEKYLRAEVQQISIFMSPLNVHVNRSPCDGRVKTVSHNKGKFLAAYLEEASVRNENIEMVLSTHYGDILVRQVAGYVARRAVCRVAPGAELGRGERYGMIKFSSRVDLYLPKGAIIKVSTGQAVRAGETVVAEWQQ